MENVVEEHSQRRQREGDAFVAKDMIDRLLQLADDPNLEVKLTRDSVKAAAVIVEWAISELLKNPEVFAKATEELDGVIGRGRWVTEKDMSHLPYMDAIVKETMRMHMVVPLLSPRLSREDTSVAGYDIPAGTRVLVNAWTISRDPDLWDAPEEFGPERFVGSKMDVKGQDFELLPFGSGRRMCPGYSLGLKVIQLTLANLLHGFAWRLPDGMTKEELSMEEVFGLSTPRKFPLQAVVEPKLPAHLYLPPSAAFLAIALGLALFLGAFHFHGRHCRHAHKLPPGPKPWPIIGNMNLLGDLPHRSIHELSKRYGPLMQLRFGSLPVLIVSSPEMARHVLKTHDAAFSDRPRFAIGRYTAYDCSDVLWSPYGPYLRQARKICTAELFSAKRLESFEHVRDEEVRVLLRGLHRSSSRGRTVRLRDYLQMLTLGVISRVVLGRKYVGEEAAAARDEMGVSSTPAITPGEFREMVDEFFVLHGAFNIGDFIPWLDWLDLQGYVRRMKMMSAVFDRFLESVLDVHNERRRLEGERFVPKDMVDVLLQLADDPNLEDLIIGATDTAANTLEWAISELLKSPKILAKATEELNKVIGLDRLVTERDLPHLPYIEAVLKETMRVHPAAPMLAPHQAREHTCVDGYDILAGTTVFVNVWGMGHDPALWDEPEEFRPERFLENKIDMRGQDFELLPFGSGRRMCPGYSLALKVMMLGLANMIHAFVWRLPEGMTVEDLSMEETYLLAMPRKFPLEATVEPRLPAGLYMGA
ncbi:hypothetical protein HU200_002273 [Digitaria exilis]|uniref:Cytochrome P450 n=1 Tax=Digitaria exilis TaxID=1010633 RepID=A0A835FYG7_9POAL|nr:hypothetical protein HU200_002273 [Digitaria exilis]